MAVITLAKDGVVLQHIPLVKERITIGRRTYNDIVIDEPGVSADHAELVFALGDLYFQDKGSTNGSRVNGQPVQKHFMNDGDVIELGQTTMHYRAEQSGLSFQDSLTSGMPSHGAADAIDSIVAQPGGYGRPGTIEILNGHHSGKKIALTQPLTTIGSPRVQVAVLARGQRGYSLTHVEGKIYPIINGKSSGMATQGLSDGDLIDLAGTQLRFFLGPRI